MQGGCDAGGSGIATATSEPTIFSESFERAKERADAIFSALEKCDPVARVEAALAGLAAAKAILEAEFGPDRAKRIVTIWAA